jgi:hypothetical protein
MRILFYIAILVMAVTFSVLTPSEGVAQTWKPLCVGGGNTAGAHNSTWQKLNVSRNGDSTWKRAGECISVTPPPPPPPPPPAGPVCTRQTKIVVTNNGCKVRGIEETVEQHAYTSCYQDGKYTQSNDEIINDGVRSCRDGKITWR